MLINLWKYMFSPTSWPQWIVWSLSVLGELALGLAVDCLANRLFSCYLSRRYIVATDENGKHGKEIYQAHGKVSKLALDRDKR